MATPSHAPDSAPCSPVHVHQPSSPPTLPMPCTRRPLPAPDRRTSPLGKPPNYLPILVASYSSFHLPCQELPPFTAPYRPDGPWQARHARIAPALPYFRESRTESHARIAPSLATLASLPACHPLLHSQACRHTDSPCLEPHFQRADRPTRLFTACLEPSTAMHSASRSCLVVSFSYMGPSQPTCTSHPGNPVTLPPTVRSPIDSYRSLKLWL